MKLTKNSKLYITKGAALYLGSVIDTEFHKHHALQFTFGLNNDFEIIIEENSLVTKSILLNVNCRHKLIGKDFTFSSHEAGFADSAHMSRTFKEMFGINLFDIFHNSRSIQVFLCNN